MQAVGTMYQETKLDVKFIDIKKYTSKHIKLNSLLILNNYLLSNPK